MSYEVQSKDWFKKNEKQRERILDRFGKVKLSPAEHGVCMPVHETDEGADTRHTESGLYIALELFYVCYKKHFSRS